MSPVFHNVKRVGKAQTFSERNIFPIVTPEQLLTSLQREKILNDIKNIINVPPEVFESLYKELIYNFVKFVQILPVNNEAKLGSLMDEGLFRAFFALQTQKQETVTEEPSPLMVYVIFSAALLFDIGFVIHNRTVNIVDKQGTFINNWQPHLGAMQKGSNYYKIRRGGGMQPWLCRRVATLFARQVMPEIGFNWIAGDPVAFNIWLTLLGNEREGIESLKLYIDRASELLEEIKLKQELFIITDIDIHEAKEVLLGEEFLEWLEQGIAAGTISVNKPNSNVHVIQDGATKIFIRIPEIFQEFSDKNPKRPNANVVLEQFKKLGFLKLIDGDIKTERYIFTSGKTTSATFQTNAQQISSRISLFKDSFIKVEAAGKAETAAQVATNAAQETVQRNLERDPQSAATGIVAAKFNPLDKATLNIANYGFQIGTLINGPTAVSLLGRININIDTPANSLLPMDSITADTKGNDSKQQADNYPPEAFQVNMGQSSTPAKSYVASNESWQQATKT
jgi:hypothetical protein